jgi:predicted Fe-S protein YdhL (DUF1289 family)
MKLQLCIVLFACMAATTFAVDALSKEEMDACMIKLSSMESERKGNVLGLAWNRLSASERSDVLRKIAALENEPVDETVLAQIVTTKDTPDPSAKGEGCAARAMVTSPARVWNSLTPVEKEAVEEELESSF